MLMDQKLDLTLAVIILPMLVEPHHVGIYFKCNTYDLLSFTDKSSLSTFTSFRSFTAMVLLKVVLFVFIFVLFNPFLYYCFVYLKEAFCLNSYSLTSVISFLVIVFLLGFFWEGILPLNSGCSHPVNYGVMFDYMLPFESNNTILLKHSNSIFMLCTKH